MNHMYSLAAAILTLSAAATLRAADTAKDSRCYELRVYTAADGKLDALHARFRDHTCKLFEKHGITNIGYWVPLENAEHKLYYILAYPSRDAREKSWRDFMADPDWKAAFAASEKDGKLVTHVDSTFLHATDFSPEIKPSRETPPRVFELRTYTATPKNLAALHARFRDHTIALFAKHGMTNYGYWAVDANQPDADKKRPGDTLIYMLAHKSKQVHDESFKTFRDDPEWIAAKDASEKAAGGSLTITDGVKSVLLAPTDYSPTK
jgi:L-rhamnose mutarotase